MNHPFANLTNNNKTTKPGEKCETCTDFQDWLKQQNTSIAGGSSGAANSSVKQQPVKTIEEERPLFRDEYGRVAWSYLHTMAAYYPKEPTAQQQTSMSQFITTFTEFFPCKECADDFKEE